MRFLVPQGIGDAAWALFKVQSIARAHEGPDARIDIALTCRNKSTIESRALDFVRRFSFVDSVEMRPGLSIHRDPVFTPEGYWNYIDDGFYDFDGERFCVLIPNAALERGQRLESWLPRHAINWRIFDDFRIMESEQATAQALEDRLGHYVVFYPGPLDGNTTQGHNRNTIWRPSDWIALGAAIHKRYRLPIVTVGAPYDAPYYDSLLGPFLNGSSGYWTNLIGNTTIGELYAITSQARFCVSYQAGVGIVATYLGTPTAIFWRARGDSIVPDAYLSFEERMASAWAPPAMLAAGTHLPLIYGRHGVDHIMTTIANRGWAI